MEKQADPVVTALRFNDCINRRDLNELCNLMTDDHLFIDSLNLQVEGKENNRKIWKDFFELFPDYQNIFETVTQQENIVVMQGYCTCSDERLSNVHSIWTAIIIDEKLKEWRVWADTPENRETIGI